MSTSESMPILSEGLSVVLRGHFNPAIISPAWLVNKGLLGEAESHEVVEQTIIPRASIFAVAWLRVEVTDDRFALHSTEPLEYQRLRDVAVGVLDALPETPLAVMGLNRNFQVQLSSEEAWHAMGDRLMPKECWSDVLTLPGLRTATVEGVRSDEYLGFIRVRVEPSNVVRNGLFIEVNDHYVLERMVVPIETRADLDRPENADALGNVSPSSDRLPVAREILSTRWEDSLASAGAICDSLIHLAAKVG